MRALRPSLLMCWLVGIVVCCAAAAPDASAILAKASAAAAAEHKQIFLRFDASW